MAVAGDGQDIVFFFFSFFFFACVCVSVDGAIWRSGDVLEEGKKKRKKKGRERRGCEKKRMRSGKEEACLFVFFLILVM